MSPRVKNWIELVFYAFACLLGGGWVVAHFPPSTAVDWFYIALGLALSGLTGHRFAETWARL